MSRLEIEETLFFQQSVLQVGVLSHAEAFRHIKGDEFCSFLRPGFEFAKKVLRSHCSQDNQLSATETKEQAGISFDMGNIWKELVQAPFHKAFIPLKYEGWGMPESATIPLLGRYIRENPVVGYYLAQTVEVARLIDKYGSPDQQDNYCDKLYRGTWIGVTCLFEDESNSEGDTFQVRPTEKTGVYELEGIRSTPMFTGQRMAENIIHIVPARIKTDSEERGELSLFIVPDKRFERETYIDNHVGISGSCFSDDSYGLCCDSLVFGDGGNCLGYRLSNVGQGIDDLLISLSGIRLISSLQTIALIESIRSEMLKKVKEKTITSIGGASSEKRSMEERHPRTSALLWLKAYREGLTGAVFSSSFYSDFKSHAGEKQREYFSDLLELYANVLTTCSFSVGFEALRKGTQIMRSHGSFSGGFIGHGFREMVATHGVGGGDYEIALELIDHTLLKNDGRALTSLIDLFQMVDIRLIKTEPLVEAVRVWQDYIGGIIVLRSDLEKNRGKNGGASEEDFKQYDLYAEEISSIFADVIVCYHLIRQGIEAERKLEEHKINFFNLEQEVKRKPDLWEWYDKLITVEFFALNVLSRHESAIQIIQKNSKAALKVISNR